MMVTRYSTTDIRVEKMHLRSRISSGSTKAPRGIVSSTKSVHLMVKKMTMMIKMVKKEGPVYVNDWDKSDLSGRRVVVSISSTSDRSCLWKPGLMILHSLAICKVLIRRRGEF